MDFPRFWIVCIFQQHLCNYVNTLRPRQNGRHFADDIFKCIFLNKNAWILLAISLKFASKGPINNIPALVQIMAWRWPGDKPLSESMTVWLLTHICVTRPQWVNWMITIMTCKVNQLRSMLSSTQIEISILPRKYKVAENGKPDRNTFQFNRVKTKCQTYSLIVALCESVTRKMLEVTVSYISSKCMVQFVIVSDYDILLNQSLCLHFYALTHVNNTFQSFV